MIGKRVTVSHDKAYLVADMSGDEGGTVIVANTGAKAVDLGGADVTSGTGYALAASAKELIVVPAGEQLFAITGGTDTTTISVLEPGTPVNVAPDPGFK